MVDKLNPHLSARLLTAFARFKKFDSARKAAARLALEGLLAIPDLSTNARETVERILA